MVTRTAHRFAEAAACFLPCLVCVSLTACRDEPVQQASTTAAPTASFQQAEFPSSIRGQWYKEFSPAEPNSDSEYGRKDQWKRLTVGATTLTYSTETDSGDPQVFAVECSSPSACTFSNEIGGGSLELAGEALVVAVKAKTQTDFSKVMRARKASEAQTDDKKQAELGEEADRLARLHFAERALEELKGSWDKRGPRPISGVGAPQRESSPPPNSAPDTPAAANNSSESCLARCGLEQNACVLRCGESETCVLDCAAKGQTCAGKCY